MPPPPRRARSRYWSSRRLVLRFIRRALAVGDVAQRGASEAGHYRTASPNMSPNARTFLMPGVWRLVAAALSRARLPASAFRFFPALRSMIQRHLRVPQTRRRGRVALLGDFPAGGVQLPAALVHYVGQYRLVVESSASPRGRGRRRTRRRRRPGGRPPPIRLHRRNLASPSVSPSRRTAPRGRRNP